jgi:hypothetical protein
MIEAWLAALEASTFAQALRGSVWVYPLVNAAHLLGIALLVGGIVPLDLRLLGAWPGASVEALWRVLTRTAAVGLALAVTAGALLFVTRATDYIASPFFLTKMVVVGVGLANVLGRRALAGRKHLMIPNTALRLAAVVSLASWLPALVLGRLIGYF